MTNNYGIHTPIGGSMPYPTVSQFSLFQTAVFKKSHEIQ